jgi:hypothetical protein
MLESQYQALLIKRLEALFNGCVIMKNDAGYRQGFPDLLVLFNDRWATLEVKSSEDAPHQANQDYWVDRLRAMSFSAFIFPQNEHEVLVALREFFGTY